MYLCVRQKLKDGWLELQLESGVSRKKQIYTLYIIYIQYTYTVNAYYLFMITTTGFIEGCTMAMATTNSPQFITDWYHSCIGTFEKVTTGVDNLTPDSNHVALALQLIQDQLGRFRVWAGNMGAHHPARSRMSLDYKLAEASHIHNKVVKLLEELNTSLESSY